jgi:hypothetical protein
LTCPRLRLFKQLRKNLSQSRLHVTAAIYFPTACQLEQPMKRSAKFSGRMSSEQIRRGAPESDPQETVRTGRQLRGTEGCRSLDT